VVDRSTLNWLYITYNTVEELVRVTPGGKTRPAAMLAYKWRSPLVLDVWLRPGNRFHSGRAVTAQSVLQAFTEQQRWTSPHPPGTQLNIDHRTRLDVLGPRHLRFTLPGRDGLLVGKLRAMHIMEAGFWEDLGFGYAREESTGEGHW
jgi:MarR-like DNA-binding transcriptional regulator SgrR of sgrS sRNA